MRDVGQCLGGGFLGGVEADPLPGALGIQYGADCVDQRLCRFGLQVQIDRQIGRNAFERLVQSRNAGALVAVGLLAIGGLESRSGIEQCQCVGIPGRDRALGIGQTVQVGGAVQYRYTIGTQLHAQPQGIGMVGDGRVDGDQSVFRGIAGAAAVGDQGRTGRAMGRQCAAGAGQQGGKEHQGNSVESAHDGSNDGLSIRQG